MIYVVIFEDRHVDVEVEAFHDKEKAIAHARKIAKDWCKFEEFYEEHHEKVGSDALFHATYSSEGDQISVVEVRVQ
jgi:hypothetical protein